MPYNPFIATSSRLARGISRFNDGATAGGAKTPRVATNKSDLEAQAEQHGWTPRELTYKDVQGMSSAELRCHEQFNADNLQKVFDAETNKRNNKEVKKVMEVRRMWTGNTSDDENRKAEAVANEFANRYPAFVRNIENTRAMTRYMIDHDLDGTKIDSYVTAFEALAIDGAVTVSPKAAGVGPQETLSGHELKSYASIHLFLQPCSVTKRDDKLSADEYLARHPELHDARIPPVIQRRQQVAAQTAVHFQDAANAKLTGTVVNIVDYDKQR